LTKYPVSFNEKFLSKLVKYHPHRENCRRWHQTNMLFYIDHFQNDKNVIKIFCQLRGDNQTVFKKFVLLERFENHQSCRLCDTYIVRNGFFILEHRCENKSTIRIINLHTNASTIFETPKMIPCFISIFWIKKMNEYVYVDRTFFNHSESFFSVRSLRTFSKGKDFNTKAKRYLVMNKFCQKSNNVVIIHLNGVVVVNVNNILKI
jgi:hypothetical protein